MGVDVPRLVVPSDVAIFDCPCCGQAVGIRKLKRTFIVRYHKHEGGGSGMRCIFAGAKKSAPLVYGGIIWHNVNVLARGESATPITPKP